MAKSNLVARRSESAERYARHLPPVAACDRRSRDGSAPGAPPSPLSWDRFQTRRLSATNVSKPELTAIVLSSDCRELRRSLTPIAWTVLEEVLLDALADGDQIIATTSVRRIAAQLDIDAGTAASALRLLRNRRLLELKRCSGPAGRFGLSTYVVLTTPGIRLLPPCGSRPHTKGPCAAGSPGEEPSPRNDRRRPAPAARTAEADVQATFNLDW